MSLKNGCNSAFNYATHTAEFGLKSDVLHSFHQNISNFINKLHVLCVEELRLNDFEIICIEDGSSNYFSNKSVKAVSYTHLTLPTT